jgi:hypothetical protein
MCRERLCNGTIPIQGIVEDIQKEVDSFRSEFQDRKNVAKVIIGT